MISKFFTTLFVLVLPFFGKALTRAAAEEVGKYLLDEKSDQDKIIHPSRRSAHMSYDRRPRRYPDYNRVDPSHTTDRPFHDVLMVAFDIAGPNARIVHEWLQSQMPEADAVHPTNYVKDGSINDQIYLDSWWVANDERFDHSDTDSAVFVHKGKQDAARKLLRYHGFA